ncbi:MAG TPA: DUF368 domain-containing protein, partial [Pseudomonadaceae bacterium]|nr:DUF368 domain-containing protein [Pseudomonadaceae bacterium]
MSDFQPPRTTRQHLLLFLKGMAMGAADSIPGVSGGTIAFITNIYDELLASIRAVSFATARVLWAEGPRAAWTALNGNFLLVLGLGVVLALLASANLVVWLLEQHYTYLMCFFNGLVLASLPFVLARAPRMHSWHALLFLVGVLFSAGLAYLPQLAGPNHLLYYFFCGAVAICAMILPGISGAFILLLLGAYEPVLTALTEFEWSVILIFVSGCVCGLLAFSHLLHWLLNRARAATLACLLGVLAGSVVALWPWRAAVPLDSALAALDHRAVSYRNLAPAAVDVRSGVELSWWALGLLPVAGALSVVVLE